MTAIRATRLDDTPQASREPDRLGLGHPCACLECGTPYTPRQSDAEFCGPACRKDWHNRRMARGAEVYDLLMCLRWDRVERAGRRSWTPPGKVLARKPYLRAERLTQSKGGRGAA